MLVPTKILECTIPRNRTKYESKYEELESFRDNLSKDMKSDLADFREDVNGKLREIVSDLKETNPRAEEAPQRVADIEEWAAAAKKVLSQSLRKLRTNSS